ncbi:MAG TPA: hypothetical protein VGK21_13515, partial [Candidatus Angelobacter sp.]
LATRPAHTGFLIDVALSSRFLESYSAEQKNDTKANQNLKTNPLPQRIVKNLTPCKNANEYGDWESPSLKAISLLA